MILYLCNTILHRTTMQSSEHRSNYQNTHTNGSWSGGKVRDDDSNSVTADDDGCIHLSLVCHCSFFQITQGYIAGWNTVFYGRV